MKPSVPIRGASGRILGSLGCYRAVPGAPDRETLQLLEDAATGDVRQRGERGIEVGIRILNHMVQYLTTGFHGMQGRVLFF